MALDLDGLKKALKIPNDDFSHVAGVAHVVPDTYHVAETRSGHGETRSGSDKAAGVDQSPTGGHVALQVPATCQVIDATSATYATCQKHSFGFCVSEDGSASVEPDIATPITDPDFWRRVADERNANAAKAGRTDRYCACQVRATVAIGKRRVSPKNPEGVQRWLCQECFDAGAPFPIPTPRKNSPGVADAPPIELNSVPRPDEPARADWWDQPVQGWRQGRLTISPMVDDETFEINLKKGQKNDD